MTTLSLASILAEAARRRPEHLAVVEGDQRITFADLWRQARTQAAALIRLGIRPGDRVALMCPNTAEFPRAYYAILATGAVVVPVHLLLTAEEAEQVLSDSGAHLLLCHARFSEVGSEAARKAGARMFTVGPRSTAPGSDGRLEDLAETTPPVPAFASRAPEDPAVVFYTSGTTGTPKGAVLSHLNLVMNATVNALDANDVRPDDVALGALPLFHTFGQTVSMNSTWRVGATLVLQPRFDPVEAIDLMVAEGVNTFHGVPTMYIGLIDAARTAARLPRLKLCISGGASLPSPVLERFNEAFGAQVYEGYGLSETSPTAAVNQPAFGTRAGTVGHALWGVDVEIADHDTTERIELLPAGALGEIVIRGGFNVYPREVEEVLLRHPGIAEAAVIGVPDPVRGEEVCAVLVRDPTIAPAPTAEEVIAYAREHLAKHKYPRRVEFVDALPLGPSHKVLKRELRERFGTVR